jgi:CheY-like chemotaxis protein/PAS domain-containing protein/HPt (histidine-containing phosphotransfer) domain-containing protein
MTREQKVAVLGVFIASVCSVLCFVAIPDMLMAAVCSVAIAAVTATVFYMDSSKTIKNRIQAVISAANKELQATTKHCEQKIADFANQKQLIETIIENIPYCIFWKDTKSVYRGCSDSFAKIYGTGKAVNVISRTDHDLGLPEELAERFRKQDSEVIKSDAALFNIKETVIDANGKPLTVITSKIPLHDAATGSVRGVLGMHISLADLKEISQSITSELPHFTDVFSIMPTGVVSLDSHDTIIETNAYFSNLFDGPEDIALGKSVFDYIRGGSARTLKNIIESFKSAPESAVETFQYTIDGNHFQITAQPVFAQQVYAGAVMNITNVSALAEDAEQISKDRDQLFAKLSYEIRTSVSGIIGSAELLRQEKLAPEQIEFVDMICTSSENLLDNLDEVSIEANINSSFLPDKTPLKSGEEIQTNTKEAIQTDEDESIESPSCGGGSAYILTVDDMPENNTLMSTILKKAGYEVISCESGEAAIRLAEREKFDVILMDIQMPGITGIEATRTIRSGGVNSKTPIIAVTASADKKSKLDCLEIGCDDYIFKPAKTELILKKIGRFIRQKKQFETAASGDSITSSLAENPDYHKMIDVFVKDLPKQIEQMRDALEQNNLHELCLYVHSLRELSGFAGFPVYTEKADDIERILHDNQIDKVSAELDELAKLCHRTSSARV